MDGCLLRIRWAPVLSVTLLKFAESFVVGRLTAEQFSDAYIELWKIERDLGLYSADDDKLSEALSTIFCFADLYFGGEDREEYELDDHSLRLKVREVLDLHSE